MKRKELIWIASTRKDLSRLPEDVQDHMGYALHFAQIGKQHPSAKPLKGFGGVKVLEIVDFDADGTYRVMYTVEMPDCVFALHAFQKKSKHGIKTPKQDIDLVKTRLKQAQDMYKQMSKREVKS